MITPELKKKREVRLKTLMEKFQKKLKEVNKMTNKAERKRNTMEYDPNGTNKNAYKRSNQERTERTGTNTYGGNK